MIETTFLKGESTVINWKNMIERVQRKDKIIEHYFHEKVKYCINLNMGFYESKF